LRAISPLAELFNCIIIVNIPWLKGSEPFYSNMPVVNFPKQLTLRYLEKVSTLGYGGYQELIQ